MRILLAAAMTALTTMVRIVCANTEQMALKSAKTSWTMTHRQSLQGKVAEAREALQLSDRYKVPVDTIQRNLDLFRSKAAAEQLDIPKMQAQSPGLTKWLEDAPENAPAVKDDLGVLGKVAGDALGKSVGGLFGNALGPLGGIVGGVSKLGDEAFHPYRSACSRKALRRPSLSNTIGEM